MERMRETERERREGGWKRERGGERTGERAKELEETEREKLRYNNQIFFEPGLKHNRHKRYLLNIYLFIYGYLWGNSNCGLGIRY